MEGSRCALAGYLNGLDGLQVAIVLERLTAEGMALVQSLKEPKPGDDVLTTSQRLANGKSAYDEPGGSCTPRRSTSTPNASYRHQPPAVPEGRR